MGEDVPPRYQKNLAFCRCTTSIKCDLSLHLHTKDRKSHKRFLRRTWMSLAFRQKLELLPLLPSWNWQRFRWGAVSLPAIFSRKPEKSGKFHLYPFPSHGFLREIYWDFFSAELLKSTSRVTKFLISSSNITQDCLEAEEFLQLWSFFFKNDRTEIRRRSVDPPGWPWSKIRLKPAWWSLEKYTQNIPKWCLDLGVIPIWVGSRSIFLRCLMWVQPAIWAI